MKAFVIVEQGYEYNDEYYHMPEQETVVRPDAMTNKKQATDLVDQLNGASLRDNPHLVSEDGEVILPYKLVEIEVPV